MAEIEGKGLDYERYAMDRLSARWVREHGLRTVLEVPAKGEKAMPSLYSLGFGHAGCAVTLVNGVAKSKPAWNELGFDVRWVDCPDVRATRLPDRGFDLVWNFMQLAQFEDKPAMLREMTRLSRRFVLFMGVNRFNPGFLSHRTVHRVFDVPWTHGDPAFMSPFHVRRFFKQHGLEPVEVGFVDMPPYPDSLGIRDMKLHRKNVDLNTIDWKSRTVEWMKSGQWPFKIRAVYALERMPLPFFLNLLRAHLFYVLGKVR